MLELIFQGFAEWAYELVLECWEYFSTALLDIMSMDYAYMKSHVPVMDDIIQVLMAVGWALLIGNLVFQALKSMMSGLGFEGEDPKLLFTRSFVFSFLLLASPQICEIGLSITARIIDLLQVPTAVHVTLVDKSIFGTLTASWLLAILFGIIIIFKTLRLLLEIAERYVILAVLTMTAPLAFAMGGSKSTADIFSGWCRMYGSMCLLMVTNVIFFKMLLSVLSTVPSGLDVFLWIVLILTLVKVARKADAIITRIGLNPAITGDTLGRAAARRTDLHGWCARRPRTLPRVLGSLPAAEAAASPPALLRAAEAHARADRSAEAALQDILRAASIRKHSGKAHSKGQASEPIPPTATRFRRAECRQPRRNIAQHPCRRAAP